MPTIQQLVRKGRSPKVTKTKACSFCKDKKAVIAYLEALDEQPGYAGFSFGSLGPVSEGIVAWLVGLGLLVGFAVWIAAHTTRSSKKKDEAQA